MNFLIRLMFPVMMASGLSETLQAQETPISIVYPRQGILLSTTDSVIVLGQVKSPHIKVFINDQRILTADDGAFVGFVGIDGAKIEPDSDFVLNCRLETKDSVYFLERRVRIPISPAPLDSVKAMIDPYSLTPTDSIWLLPGEKIGLKCRATPGAQLYYSVINSNGSVTASYVPLAETEPDLTDNFGESSFGVNKSTKRRSMPGLYSADFFLPLGLNNARIRFCVVKGKDTVYAESAARLNSIENGNMGVAELTGEVNNATVAPGRAYYYFLPAGVRCALSGRIGSQLQLQLSANHSAWLSANNVKFLPRGTVVPSTFIPIVRIKKTGTQSSIKLIMSERIPFKVEQLDERKLRLWLYGGISDTDWIRFENRNDDVSNVTWSQPEPDVYCLNVELARTHDWGYETHYDGSNLIWTIRHKPKSKGLKGLKICVDPGHSKDIGATGPRGVTERQVNVEVAQALKKELESDGAVVVMTHTDTSQNVSLYERVAIANQNRCDLFVSIHHNAPPDGVNPFSQAFGPSVIYYHQQSKKLAEYIQKEMVSRSGLPDFGIFQGNIAVCRNAQMPAVLVECAFLSLPDQEKMIVDPKFQKKTAKAIKEGIRKFLK